MTSLEQLPSGVTNSRIVILRIAEPKYLGITGASLRKHPNQAHCPAVDGGQTVRSDRDARLVEPTTQSCNASIRMRQHKYGLQPAVTLQCLTDQVRLAAPRWCRDRTAVDREKVNFPFSHWRPRQHLVNDVAEARLAFGRSGATISRATCSIHETVLNQPAFFARAALPSAVRVSALSVPTSNSPRTAARFFAFLVADLMCWSIRSSP